MHPVTMLATAATVAAFGPRVDADVRGTPIPFSVTGPVDAGLVVRGTTNSLARSDVDTRRVPAFPVQEASLVKRMMKGAALVAGTCLALSALPRLARSADHVDAPGVKADPAADIADLYTFMDGSRAVFVLTVFPSAPAGALFSDKVQYVLHTTSSAKLGEPETNKDIVCTFQGTAAPQTIQCWVGATDAFVTGDASGPNGVASPDGKVKVFAGLRKDPFFFNRDGFVSTVGKVKGFLASGSIMTTAGCPNLFGGIEKEVQTELRTAPGGPAVDAFDDQSTLAIVVSVDKALVTGSGPVVSAWASTNRAP